MFKALLPAGIIKELSNFFSSSPPRIVACKDALLYGMVVKVFDWLAPAFDGLIRHRSMGYGKDSFLRQP